MDETEEEKERVIVEWEKTADRGAANEKMAEVENR